MANSEQRPHFSKIASFTIADSPESVAKNRQDDNQNYCLWSDSSGNNIQLPVGATQCLEGQTFVCTADGTWVNTSQQC